MWVIRLSMAFEMRWFRSLDMVAFSPHVSLRSEEVISLQGGTRNGAWWEE